MSFLLVSIVVLDNINMYDNFITVLVFQCWLYDFYHA